MKTIKATAMLLAGIFLLQTSYGQKAVKKEVIAVNGNCERCKKKIEASAISAGATYANWNEKTKNLNVIYHPSASNSIKIETAIANAGYDTRDVKASDEAYNKLSECCQYDRDKSITYKKD